MSYNLYTLIKENNQKYELNHNNGQMISDKNYKVIKGTKPIIISAPHSVKQFREGRIKPEDIMTGSIVEYICEEFQTFGIIRTCNLGDDPNYYNNSISLEYKKEILKFIEEYNIAYLFDIHGCSNKYGFDIDIGTNSGKNISCDIKTLYELKKLFSSDLLVEIDNIFKASMPSTISNFIHASSLITCIQLELSKDLRLNPDKLKTFIASFGQIIDYLNEKSSHKLQRIKK